MKKILALLSASVLVLSLASCGSQKDAEPETVAPETTDAVEAETEAVTEEVTAEASTEAAEEETTEAEEETVGLNSTDAKEVVEFYKEACKTTGNNITVTRYKTLDKLDGGSGGVGSILSSLEKVAKKVLADQSGEDKGLRGYPELLTAADVSSAKATVNGDYTELTMNIKDYTALPMGRANEGSVGHAIGVLDTINEALDELPLTVEDTSNIRLNYTNAYVTAKVDNNTGKIVSAEWNYLVKMLINDTKAKMGISFTLDGAEIIIGYKAVM